MSETKTAHDEVDSSDTEERSKQSVDDEDADRLLNEIEFDEFELSDEEDVQDVPVGKFVWDDVDWGKRLAREEIFSKRYKPSLLETKELQQTTEELSNLFGLLNQNLESLLLGGHSIVVMRGDVIWEDTDCHLVFFTHGLVLAYKNVNALNPLAKKYEFCHMWKEVEVCYLSGESIFIKLKDGANIEISPGPLKQDLIHWMNALERILIEFTIHSPSSEELTDEVGWQYKLVRKPAFSAAVSGDISIMGEIEEVNVLDEYNHFAPLHYALQHEICNMEIVEKLLDAGADPNLKDSEGRTPMYFAGKNKLENATELLQNHGGNLSELIEIEQRGELFSRIEQSETNTSRRREREKLTEERKAAEAALKAQSVQDQMNKNMAALVERGEKIEELDNKTKDLEAEAKNFGEMAAQLKEKMRKKKWYQL